MWLRVGIALLVLAVAGCTRQGAPKDPDPPSGTARPGSEARPESTPSRDAPFTTEVVGGGTLGLRTVVETVTAEEAHGGSLRVEVTFRDGVPVWAAHRGSGGRLLWLELGAARPAEHQTSGTEGPFDVVVGSALDSSWVSVRTRKTGLQYRASTVGSKLVLEIEPGPEYQEGSAQPAPAMRQASAVVQEFLAARVRAGGAGGGALAPEAARHLGPVARLQYGYIYQDSGFTPTRYEITRESGVVPNTAVFLVRLESGEGFADETVFVTPNGERPEVSLVLGHRPVPWPDSPDGRAALLVSDRYIRARSSRRRDAMWEVLSPSAQRALGNKQNLGVGVSNPHPFRGEVLGWMPVSPDCFRFEVLTSSEYSSQGELSRGLEWLYVVREDGRWGVSAGGGCDSATLHADLDGDGLQDTVTGPGSPVSDYERGGRLRVVSARGKPLLEVKEGILRIEGTYDVGSATPALVLMQTGGGSMGNYYRVYHYDKSQDAMVQAKWEVEPGVLQDFGIGLLAEAQEPGTLTLQYRVRHTSVQGWAMETRRWTLRGGRMVP